jgi:hypothetical protein
VDSNIQRNEQQQKQRPLPRKNNLDDTGRPIIDSQLDNLRQLLTSSRNDNVTAAL